MTILTIDQILSHYFPIEFNRYEIYEKSQQSMRDQFKGNNSSKTIVCEQYGVKTFLDFIGDVDKMKTLIRYTAELNFREKGGEFAKDPIGKLKCNEYMYWGMYMNIQAFLYGQGIETLFVYNTDKVGPKKYVYRVRTDIAELLLEHFNKNYRYLYDAAPVSRHNVKTQMSIVS